jgi:hypothetical protein
MAVGPAVGAFNRRSTSRSSGDAVELSHRCLQARRPKQARLITKLGKSKTIPFGRQLVARSRPSCFGICPTMPGKRRILDDYLSRPQLAYELNKTIRSLQRWEREHLGPAVTQFGNSPRKPCGRGWPIRKGAHAPKGAASSNDGRLD